MPPPTASPYHPRALELVIEISESLHMHRNPELLAAMIDLLKVGVTPEQIVTIVMASQANG
jgi:hypothetical protein